MDIKLTQKNSILKTAGKFVSEDINLTVDDSLVGGGETKFNYSLEYVSMNGTSGYISIDGDDPIESRGGYDETGQANVIIVYSPFPLVSYTATPTTSVKFVYKKFGGSSYPCVLIIKLLENNADIYVEGKD